jgi:hypothetical protein
MHAIMFTPGVRSPGAARRVVFASATDSSTE